jgi:hypothetical protein
MNKIELELKVADALEELRTQELEEATNIVQWGLWARGGLPGGFSAGDAPTLAITDGEALMIDRVVTKLPDVTQYVIKSLYIGLVGINELMGKMHVSKQRVMDYRLKGLSTIDGALNFSENGVDSGRPLAL